MKIKNGFVLREVCGAYIVVAEGEDNMNFSKIISLNESAVCVWKAVENKDFTIEDMAEALVEDYEVEHTVALADSKMLAEQWKEVGIIQ